MSLITIEDIEKELGTGAKEFTYYNRTEVEVEFSIGNKTAERLEQYYNAFKRSWLSDEYYKSPNVELPFSLEKFSLYIETVLSLVVQNATDSMDRKYTSIRRTVKVPALIGTTFNQIGCVTESKYRMKLKPTFSGTKDLMTVDEIKTMSEHLHDLSINYNYELWCGLPKSDSDSGIVLGNREFMLLSVMENSSYLISKEATAPVMCFLASTFNQIRKEADLKHEVICGDINLYDDEFKVFAARRK